jgi:hypothetical protein
MRTPAPLEVRVPLYAGRIEGVETVRVPGRVVSGMEGRLARPVGNRLIWEHWCAPGVRQLVRSREMLSNGIETRALLSFKLTE